jgi:hypothetical protein
MQTQAKILLASKRISAVESESCELPLGGDTAKNTVGKIRPGGTPANSQSLNDGLAADQLSTLLIIAL